MADRGGPKRRRPKFLNINGNKVAEGRKRMKKNFQMGEFLKCGDFVGRLCGHDESPGDEVIVYLHRPSSVEVAGIHYRVDDYRAACEKALRASRSQRGQLDGSWRCT
jgi:hypothetical protein